MAAETIALIAVGFAQAIFLAFLGQLARKQNTHNQSLAEHAHRLGRLEGQVTDSLVREIQDLKKMVAELRQTFMQYIAKT